ncbi:MAG: hypothetical protein ACMZ66_12995 [Thalassospira sp.]|uniref:hypothetical protein n=1 Tax=Thalassospira sp. TaxID=1912094 RepID=UPI003A844A08
MTSTIEKQRKATQTPWDYDWGQKTDGVVKYWIIGPTELDEQKLINTIVTVDNDRDDAEDLARLISAAPSLLAQLKFLVNHIEGNMRLSGKTERAISNFTATYHATIAQAESANREETAQ